MDTPQEYPNTDDWPLWRLEAHLLDAHQFSHERLAAVNPVRAHLHDEDHQRGVKGGIPHTHADPKLTAEQGISQLAAFAESYSLAQSYEFMEDAIDILRRTEGS